MAMLFFQPPPLSRGDMIVGAYYYPWYGRFPGGHSFSQTMRQQLTPPQPPALGYYDSGDGATIAAHIDQSHRGNIRLWAISWWGPKSAEDTIIRTRILTAPRARRIEIRDSLRSHRAAGKCARSQFFKFVA